MMKNLEIVSLSLTEWLENILKSVLPNVRLSNSTGIGKVMNGFFGIDLNNYNIWNELGFLTTPIIKGMLEPYLVKTLSFVDDDKIQDMVYNMVNTSIEQAKIKGHINMFGIELGENAFVGLKEILDRNFIDRGNN